MNPSSIIIKAICNGIADNRCKRSHVRHVAPQTIASREMSSVNLSSFWWKEPFLWITCWPAIHISHLWAFCANYSPQTTGRNFPWASITRWDLQLLKQRCLSIRDCCSKLDIELVTTLLCWQVFNRIARNWLTWPCECSAIFRHWCILGAGCVGALSMLKVTLGYDQPFCAYSCSAVKGLSHTCKIIDSNVDDAIKGIIRIWWWRVGGKFKMSIGRS